MTMSKTKGKFIVFEGMDGTGKSTISKRINEWLTSIGKQVVLTKEPGGSTIGNKCREIILYNTSINKLTDILLFLASRNEHIYRVLKPGVEEGKIILCDRYVYSSFVYQGFMNNNFKQVYKLHKDLKVLFEPDLLLIFKANPDVTIKRLSNGDKFEMHDRSYFEKIQNYYLTEIPKLASEKCKVEIIDANLSIDDIFENVKKSIVDIIS